MPPPAPPSSFDAVSPTSRVTNPASVHPSGVNPPQPVTRWGFVKLALGGAIAGVLVSYNTLLETTCANMDPYEGGGELIVTQGGGAKGTQAGRRFPAPLLVNAGAQLAANGTVDAPLLWVEELCDGVLDCSSCPVVLDSGFNISTLRGKLLLYGGYTNEVLTTCGMNRLGRAFGHTELVGLGYITIAPSGLSRFFTPGLTHKIYRLGEFRDAWSHDGDAGIPFPHFELKGYLASQFLIDSGVVNGETGIRVKITPTLPNPWRPTFCGYWKQLSTLLMLGHAAVVELAISNWIGHIQRSGLRFDLAQLALATETIAHVFIALSEHDPTLAFHWAALPFGAYPAFVLGSIVMTCSSTLLLAAFWYQMIERDGLASVACECRPARVLTGVAVLMELLSYYLVVTEVRSAGCWLILVCDVCIRF